MNQTIEMSGHGHVAIPKNVRDKLGIEVGQRYAIRALEGGALLLTPQPGKASADLAELRESLIAKGSSREEMLTELRQMRYEGRE